MITSHLRIESEAGGRRARFEPRSFWLGRLFHAWSGVSKEPGKDKKDGKDGRDEKDRVARIGLPQRVWHVVPGNMKYAG